MFGWLTRTFHRIKSAVFTLGPAFEFLQHHVPPVDRLTEWKFAALRRRREQWQPRRVLDFACGTGHIAPIFAGAELVGADVNVSYLRTAARRAPDARWVVVDPSGRLPFPDRRFDLILFLCAMHHLPDAALHRILPELRRVLAPDGRLLVIEGMAAEHHTGWLVWGMLKLDMGDCFRTPEQLRALLERDFSVDEYAEENSRPDGKGYRLPCFVLRPRTRDH